MSFDWSEYLDLAAELAGQNPTHPAGQEARLRSAISRAYYATFIQARNYLQRKYGGRTIALDARAHQMVQEHFANSSNRQRRQVGTILLELRLWRNRADYDNTVRDLAETARLAVRQSRRVLKTLRNLDAR